MSRLCSRLVVWLCTALLLCSPLVALYFLFNITQFAELASKNLGLAIRWATVVSSQWYGLWALTLVNFLIGWLGIYYLRLTFINFAKGEMFTTFNSRNLRRFAILLFVQAFAQPVYHSVSSVLLSWNHPPGQKVLSLSFGSDDLKLAVVALIFWVVSDLLVKATSLDSENKQFI